MTIARMVEWFYTGTYTTNACPAVFPQALRDKFLAATSEQDADIDNDDDEPFLEGGIDMHKFWPVAYPLRDAAALTEMLANRLSLIGAAEKFGIEALKVEAQQWNREHGVWVPPHYIDRMVESEEEEFINLLDVLFISRCSSTQDFRKKVLIKLLTNATVIKQSIKDVVVRHEPLAWDWACRCCRALKQPGLASHFSRKVKGSADFMHVISSSKLATKIAGL
jgi:hypothetical protein